MQISINLAMFYFEDKYSNSRFTDVIVLIFMFRVFF